ncbi:glycosyltransferase [Rhodococcus sp. NPDC057297]|uniref:glycosyltransferase n=1 Tax=Rhodococcus sp. NPDC057297 TaxID=3346090 RepID=UPI003627568D
MTTSEATASRRDVLLCAGPFDGHVEPLLPVASELIRQGHRVDILAGARYRDAVERTGASFEPLPGALDFGVQDLDETFPARRALSGARRSLHDLEHLFIRPIGEQAAAIDDILARHPVDVIVAESMFFGVVPLLSRAQSPRPRVVAWGTNPLSIPGRGRPPGGLGWHPAHNVPTRLRNAAATSAVEHLVMGPSLQKVARACVTRAGGVLDVFVLDWLTLVDDIVQTTVPGFEFPTDGPVHYIGPVSRSEGPLPDWWSDLDPSKPTILVTQGSVELDLSHVVAPTLKALADRPINVIVSAPGRPPSLPNNAYSATHLPYDAVFPHLSGFVTNGGYGGVGFAIRHGVPVVAVGKSQDKADVAARVSWSGLGIGVVSQSISAAKVGASTAKILDDPRYATRARELQQQASTLPGIAGAVEILTRT